MPNFSVLPQTATLVGLATQTTSGISPVLNLSLASSYRFVVQMQTVSGTSPTLQVVVATSFDNGATYNEFLSFANLSTSGVGRQIQFRPYLGVGDQVTQGFASTLLGTADLTSGDLVVNGPINPQFIKVKWILGGTTPSIAFQVQYCAVPQDLAD
jgi:hypothetical protein